jgi:hypothetical protein
MNKRGEEGGVLKDNVVYIILLAVFVAALLYYLYGQMNGAAVWEDFYAKEIVRIVDMAKPGDYIELDISKAGEIAKKNDVYLSNQMIEFDVNAKRICVKLSTGKKTCYSYFNDVRLSDPLIERGVPGDLLTFSVGEKNG